MKHKAFKVRLYPTKEQEKTINQTIGNCRFWFNKCLDHVITWKKEHGNYENFKQLNPKDFKKELPWLAEGSSRGIQQSQNDLTVAFRNIKKMGFGFPNFKKKGQKDSYREPQQTVDRSKIKIKNASVKLNKLSWINFRTSDRYIEQLQSLKICHVTISKNKARHYFLILCEVEIPILPPSKNKVGIDLGLKEFAFTSNNESISNPHFGKKSEKKTKKLQRHLSRKTKGSRRYEKQRVKLAKAHLHVANQRNHFLNELSTKIINENQVIILEDLNISGMAKNHKLAKAIHDVSWSTFVNKLKYKSDWYGRTFHQVGTFVPSSKTCSHCGWKDKDLELKDRTFKCQNCGLEIDRDYNASINILNRGMVELTKTGKHSNMSPTFVDKSTSGLGSLLSSLSNLVETKTKSFTELDAMTR